MPTKLTGNVTRLAALAVPNKGEFHTSNMARVANRVGLMLVLACLTVGCGSSGKPFDIVPVEGKVTYEDGTPIPGVYVQFVPQTPALDPKTHPRPGVAEIADDGTIEDVTTYEYGDGIVPGEHKVIVKPGKSKEQRNSVSPKYNNVRTTPLTVNTADIPFDIKIEKP